MQSATRDAIATLEGRGVRRGMPFATGTVDAICMRHVPEHVRHGELTRQDRMGFDLSLMRELLEDIGFTDIRRVSRAESCSFPQSVLGDTEPDAGWINSSRILEAGC